MGEKAFSIIQSGQQAAFGTAVAATRKLMGKLDPGEDRKPKFPNDPLGNRARAARVEVDQIHADNIQFTTPEGGYFQLLPLLFSMGLKGGVTPVEQTVDQDDYLWNFTPDLEGNNSPVPATLEYGDDTQAYEIQDVLARRYVIEGNVGEDQAVSITMEGFGKEIIPTTFTPSLADPAIAHMSANMVKFYIDSAWANLGNTIKNGLLRKYRVEILTGVHPKFWGQGVKTMTGFAESYIDVAASFTFEGNADADTLFDAYQARTAKAIRLVIEGLQIGTGENHSSTYDIYGFFEKVVPLDEEKDGNNLHTALFHGVSDQLATPHLLGVNVITDLASINPA